LKWFEQAIIHANSPLQRRVLAATAFSYVIVILDTSIVNVALDPIAHSLSTGISGLQWVVNSYTLVFASLLLTGGTLGDRWGARNVYLSGLALFTSASIACGLAPSLPVLIASRAMQGVGAAMLVPCALKLINHAFPIPEQRAKAIGVWIGCGGIALAAGPLAGGLLIQLFGWRSIFFLNLPIGLTGIWMAARVSEDHDALTSGSNRFDLPGQISAIIALGGLIAILIEGQTLGWNSPIILAATGIVLVAWLAFFTIEARVAHPMLPLAFFRNSIFIGSTFASMASAFVFYGLLFITSIYYQQVRGYSPLWTGLAFLPITAMVTVGSIGSSQIAKRFGAHIPMCVAFGFYAPGSVGLLFSTRTSEYWMAVAPMIAIGLASGFITPASTAPALGTVATQRAGIAAATLNAARQMGSALGVAIFGTLIAAVRPFDAGLRAALLVAVAVAVIAALIWWFTQAVRWQMVQTHSRRI
jgi:DHA2 family methylenomycin A resistance protein-like MFS transporter